MAFPRYRITDPTGSVIRQARFPAGTEIDVPPGEGPRRSWVPLNKEAVQAVAEQGWPLTDEQKALLEDPAPAA